MGRVTLQTVADQVGVSRMTVSNAFSRPDQLSAELRTKILAAAHELGYIGPDPAARALARGTTGAVGVVLAGSVAQAFADEVATGFFGALSEGLAPTGLAVAFLPSEAPEGMVPARDVPLDGALVYSCASATDAVDWLVRRRLPLVFVDDVPVPDVNSVVLDERAGAAAAAQHLVELGHRRVGLLTMGFFGPTGLVADPADAGSDYVSTERVHGWLGPLRAADVKITAVNVRENAEQDAYDGMQLLLGVEPPPSAVLCFSDVMALAAVHAAQDAGLRVPEDVSVIGFDDSSLARRMRPALTTVRQDLGAKGRAAAALLMDAIERSRTGAERTHEQVRIPTQLVIRHSTGPAPA